STKQNAKKEALKLQKDAQDFFQTGLASVYLESKIQNVRDLDAKISINESVDLLLEAAQIVLAD
ncbi:MAG: hypothetical protein Q7U04_05200, partial [Bacteriovorax sp.]|nr:hypothetical protein [Bacteriovorax sp.]